MKPKGSRREKSNNKHKNGNQWEKTNKQKQKPEGQ